MISVEDFLAQTPPRSALASFHEDIAKLRAANMSYKKIQLFLKLNGLDTHVNNIRGYCQRHIENQPNEAGLIPTSHPQKTTIQKKTTRKMPSLPSEEVNQTKSSPSSSSILKKNNTTHTSHKRTPVKNTAKKTTTKAAIKNTMTARTRSKKTRPQSEPSLPENLQADLF